jgi:hypothetical protein
MSEHLEMPIEAEVQASGDEPESAQPEPMTGSEIPLDPQQVACLANRYWQERGSPKDSSQENQDADWFRAESELKARIAAAAAQPSELAKSPETTPTRTAGA